jgi:putative alpha-1,2-mannosidase
VGLTKYSTSTLDGQRTESWYAVVTTGRGRSYLTQAVIRRIQTELYRNAPDGLPGNDDSGTLSSWYVFSALGIIQLFPGTATWCWAA